MNWKNAVKVTVGTAAVCIPINVAAAYLGVTNPLGALIGFLSGFAVSMRLISRWPID